MAAALLVVFALAPSLSRAGTINRAPQTPAAVAEAADPGRIAYLSIDNILWFEAVALLPLPALAG